MIKLMGLVAELSGDTFHLRTDSGEEIWVKPTLISIGTGIIKGDNIEINGVWPATMPVGSVRFFSTRKICKR